MEEDVTMLCSVLELVVAGKDWAGTYKLFDGAFVTLLLDDSVTKAPVAAVFNVVLTIWGLWFADCWVKVGRA